MKDSHHSELKCSLSAISVKALNYSSRLQLAYNLDYRQVFLSETGIARDYRGLAELVGFPSYALKKVEEFEDRTLKILESWETRPDATLGKLITYLEEMGRHDIIQELIPSFKKNVEAYLEHLKSHESPIQVAEEGNVEAHLEHQKSLESPIQVADHSTIYDAYLFYADEDKSIVQEFSNILESPEFGLKLFIRGRDVLPEDLMYADNIILNPHKFRRMLIVLTPNFIKNPNLVFQLSFVCSLTIELTNRIFVPVILEPCEIPPVIYTLCKIDFAKQNTNDWMMDNLITSLMPEDKNMPQSATCSKSKEVSSSPKQSSKKFQEFMSLLERKGNSKWASTSFSSERTTYDAYASLAYEDTYDVYVCYAYEDESIAYQFANILESPLIGLKLFMGERDCPVGSLILDVNIEVIKNRCRCMLIILTPNFIKSQEMAFYLSFACALAIEEKERILIPVILAPCEIPPILHSVPKIDFTQQNTYDRMVDKLITLLMPEDKKMHQLLAFLNRRKRRRLLKSFNSLCHF